MPKRKAVSKKVNEAFNKGAGKLKAITDAEVAKEKAIDKSNAENIKKRTGTNKAVTSQLANDRAYAGKDRAGSGVNNARTRAEGRAEYAPLSSPTKKQMRYAKRKFKP